MNSVASQNYSRKIHKAFLERIPPLISKKIKQNLNIILSYTEKLAKKVKLENKAKMMERPLDLRCIAQL